MNRSSIALSSRAKPTEQVGHYADDARTAFAPIRSKQSTAQTHTQRNATCSVTDKRPVRNTQRASHPF